MCHHRGSHVVLHGRQETSEGLSGGAAVTGGQTQPGGAEPAAGPTLQHSVFIGQHFHLWGQILVPSVTTEDTCQYQLSVFGTELASAQIQAHMAHMSTLVQKQ